MFCKIFSHYEFLVKLVFAPHFKQRHIPLYKNDNNRKTHVESTRAMTRERGARAESKNCEILLFPTADRRFDTKVKCPTGRASFWVKFPTVRSLTRVKCPGDCPGDCPGRGGGDDGRYWNWLAHNRDKDWKNANSLFKRRSRCCRFVGKFLFLETNGKSVLVTITCLGNFIRSS